MGFREKGGCFSNPVPLVQILNLSKIAILYLKGAGTPKWTQLELRSSATSMFKFAWCIYVRANSVRNREWF